MREISDEFFMKEAELALEEGIIKLSYWY